jgi:ATP-binding protein involved in chromosome partitioning
MDPRRSVIEKRLSEVGRIIAFCSAKGGVGKTFCASLSALLLARAAVAGMKPEGIGRPAAIGLFDLDFQGASAHVMLGAIPRLPEEKEGILPQRTPEGVLLLTAAAFTGERALPLRGPEVTEAVLELFAVTRWGALDLLFLDMPPGIGDEMLDLLTLVPRLEILVVSTPSAVTTAVVDRLIGFLLAVNANIIGVLANMSYGDAGTVQALADRAGIDYLGEIPFDPQIEEQIGRPGGLLGCPASRALEGVLTRAKLLSSH